MEDYYEVEPEKSDTTWAAVTCFSIALVEGGGVLLAFLVKYFGHYLEGAKLPDWPNWAANYVVDGIIQGLAMGINRAISATGPVLNEFFRFFFNPAMGWYLIALSAIGFVFGIIGIKSAKVKLAVIGILICLAVIVFYWWLISQARHGVTM